MKKILNSIEQLSTVIFLMFYSGTPLDVLLKEEDSLETGDRFIFRLLFTLTYIASFSLIALRWKKVVYVFNKDILIWVLIGVCALSSFWSSDVDTTVRRVFGLTGTTIFGLYLASRYTLRQQLKLCALMFGISAVMCFVFALLLPQHGIIHTVSEGTIWRGIYSGKNALGKRFVLSAAIFFFLIMTTQKNRWIFWLGYITSAILVLLSKSTTSLGNLLIITLAFPIYRVFRLKYQVMIPVLMFIATLGVGFFTLFVENADVFLGTVGKDTTLTGRSDLWPAVWEMIAKKPLLGYGYGAFWQGLNGESASVLQAVGWRVPNSHNGFLDVWLALGLVGLLVFIIGFLINLFRAVYLIRFEETYENLWLLVYLTYIFLSNLTETTLLEQNSIEWILYVTAVLSSKACIGTNRYKDNL